MSARETPRAGRPRARARVWTVTRRGWQAVGGTLAALLVAVYTLNPFLLLFAVAAFGFVAGSIADFLWRARDLRPERFDVQRQPGFRRVPCQTDSVSRVEATWNGRFGFWAEVVDIVPDVFTIRSGSPRLLTWWAPQRTLVVAYAYRAEVRGAHLLGPTFVTAHDPLGFCARSVLLPTAIPLTVLPESVTLRPRPMGIALFSGVPGSLPLRRPGTGSEFRSLRPYRTSDDIRHVAWKRSTPTQLMVREFDLENRQDLLVLLDLNPVMHAGPWGGNAVDHAVNASTVVAALIARQAEDRIGLLSYTGGVFQYIPPSRGPRHLKYLLDNFALVAAHEGPFDLGDALKETARRLRTHTHVLLFSSLSEPSPELRRQLASFHSRGHRLYAFVPDISELYPPLRSELGRGALDWAGAEEHARTVRAVDELRREGVPVFPYDRRGAREQMLRVYGRIRGLQVVR